MRWLAIDMGGANLKVADGQGFAAAQPFALWKAPERLEAELRALLAESPACDCLAATMTGELCDSFETKADGVSVIVDALVSAAAGRPLSIYATDGRLVTPAAAKRNPLPVAASNWHALASFAARFAQDKPALLVDVGSTTTDVIPLNSRGPAATGRTDPERLVRGELVYTGVERTPIAAIVTHLPWRGEPCPVASEHFATSADAYVLLGELPEDLDTCDTADGRPRTRTGAHARLARIICADATMFSLDDAHAAAMAIRDAQSQKIAAAIERVAERMIPSPATLILSGHGEFLARAALERTQWSDSPAEVISLNALLGPELSRCAPAHALAVLAAEQEATVAVDRPAFAVDA